MKTDIDEHIASSRRPAAPSRMRCAASIWPRAAADSASTPSTTNRAEAPSSACLPIRPPLAITAASTRSMSERINAKYARENGPNRPPRDTLTDRRNQGLCRTVPESRFAYVNLGTAVAVLANIRACTAARALLFVYAPLRQSRTRAANGRYAPPLLVVSMKVGALSSSGWSFHLRACGGVGCVLRVSPAGQGWPAELSTRDDGWSGAHLSIASSWRTRRHGRPAAGAQFQKDRQAVRRPVAPPAAAWGLKGWLVVSMCQIASVSLRAMSICATLAPRCLPRRCLVRW